MCLKVSVSHLVITIIWWDKNYRVYHYFEALENAKRINGKPKNHALTAESRIKEVHVPSTPTLNFGSKLISFICACFRFNYIISHINKKLTNNKLIFNCIKIFLLIIKGILKFKLWGRNGGSVLQFFYSTPSQNYWS